MGDLVLNGVHYSTSGNLYYPVIYSDTERKIGVWRNNKPLYQKTFIATLNNIPNNTATNVADISGLNIDDVADISGRCNYYNGADWFDVDFSTSFAVYAYPNGYLQFKQTMTNATVDRVYKLAITLQYTKTTDTAGAGNWNTDGIPTVHYSTNEQVVGTWYDGSTIYEKTFILGTSWDFTANTWVKSEINKGNMNIIVDGTIYVFYGGSPSCHKVQLGWIDNKLAGNCFRNFSAAVGSAVVLRYTKSS